MTDEIDWNSLIQEDFKRLIGKHKKENPEVYELIEMDPDNAYNNYLSMYMMLVGEEINEEKKKI